MPATKKLLLNESIKHVGRVGDVVEVSSGYARNYLLPQGLAVEPTKDNLKKIEARKLEVQRIEAERRAQQAKVIDKLSGTEVTIERRANEQGHLFGSVSATEVAKALVAQGFDVDAEDINLPGKLDHIDKYAIVVKFAEDLKTEIKVWVSPDPESKALIEESKKAQDRAKAAAAEAAAAAAAAAPKGE